MSCVNRKNVIYCVILALLVLGSDPAKADRRGYVWTYEYMTMPKGESEIEYYLTTKVPELDDFDKKNTWGHQIEWEYGLTDHWDIGIYQRWQQTNTLADDSFDYTGSKARIRRRLGEKGMYPLDTLLYMEYIRPDGSDAPEKLEGKLILAKDFGKFNIAYNQVLEVGINNNGKTENGYAVGLNYELNPNLKIGIESKGNYTDGKYWLGPTVSWAQEKYWVGLGALGGLNDRSDDLMVRMIVGIRF